MLTTILLPLDGSTLAERALPYAAALAHRSGSHIALVEAVEAHPFLGANPIDAEVTVVERAEASLRTAVSRLAADGISADAHTYYDEPVHAILDAADRHHASLIVMSTHGRSGIGRMVYGSVTDQVLRQATVPVLVVPSVVDHPWTADRPLSLLVPLDGSELAEEALAMVDFLATGEPRVTLLRIVEPPAYSVYGAGYTYVPFDEEAEVAAASEYLETQVSRLRDRGWQARSKVTVSPPGGTIADIAREQQADLIVMATHGRGGLSRLLLGSTATNTLRQATVPLLLTRPVALHRADRAPEPPLAATTGEPVVGADTTPPAAAAESAPTVAIRLSALDLELIEHGLKALSYAPGYDYGAILAAQALARRLARTAKPEAGEPVGAG
jgi:nucleotide-binding universal stress UspA family protein